MMKRKKNEDNNDDNNEDLLDKEINNSNLGNISNDLGYKNDNSFEDFK